jgi:hypothetical protein
MISAATGLLILTRHPGAPRAKTNLRAQRFPIATLAAGGFRWTVKYKMPAVTTSGLVAPDAASLLPACWQR